MALMDAQDTVNWYLEKAGTEKAKMPAALLGCPGLNPLANLSFGTGQVRGLWVLPGSQNALAVIGNQLIVLSITTPSTPTAAAQYSGLVVGTLLTSAGPVCIRDNGVQQNGLGGYAIIVDGQFGYYYLVSGEPYANVFAASTTLGNNVLSFPGNLPAGLIISPAAILTGSFGANTTLLSVDTIGLTATMANVATTAITDVAVTLNIPIFGQITDPGFLGAERILFIEGWLCFNLPGTRTFYTTGPTPYQVLFPGAFFALKDSSTDNLITLMEQNREAWMIGERTSEVWYNAGGTQFPFSRIPGVGPQIGCAAKHSIARCGAQLAWLGRNEQGQNVVVCTAQYTWERISHHGVEHAISSYAVVADALGFGYEEEGHLFYVLTFPTADVTWVFDFTSKEWHKRLSFDPTGGVYHRHRSNCFMDFADVRIVGDYKSGQLHQMSRKFYTDAGAPLRALRRSPHVWVKETRERLFFSSLQLEFTPGVGVQSGQGVSPQVMLKWSDDGSFTWGHERWVSIGAVGQTKNRALWRLLGFSRDRVWECVFTDPVPRDLIGATIYGEAA
jgi:hypothetical protein